jgi:hypothetical protein
MIVSHKYKFIFVKTHKTAGSSVEAALAPYLGEDDIITAPAVQDASTHAARNHHGDALLDRLYARHRLVRKVVNRHSPLLGAWYYEHMPAWRIREQVGETVWNTYYKFCFERNPWDKVVSYYFWKKHGQNKVLPEFRDYVLNKTHRLPMDGRLYMDGDQLLINEVIPFKPFEEGFRAVVERLGIPFEGGIPREKGGIKVDRKPYQEYYDEETKQRVAEVFAPEIRLMGYTFD